MSTEQGPADSGIERQARQALRDLGDLPVPSDASGQRFAIVVGRFYEDLAERLVQGAQAAFSAAGCTDVEVFDVPGAFELPLAARYAADSGRFRGVACLGAVIRGETDHYDFVCAEAARGIMQVQLDTGVPCAFGVLTCATMEQALARAGGGKRDQGRHAAEAVLRMAALRESSDRLRAGGGIGACKSACTSQNEGLGSKRHTSRTARNGSRARYEYGMRLNCVPQWPRYVTAAARVRRTATVAATRWSPPGGASSRTCRRCGSWSARRRSGCMSAPAA